MACFRPWYFLSPYAKCTHSSLVHSPSASSSHVNRSLRKHCLLFQLHGKSHDPLSLHAIKYLALAFMNGVQKRDRDCDTSAADCTVIVGH